MKKITLLKSLLIVLAMSFFSVVAFAQATTVGTYKKVTEAPANGDWSGQYLIVAEGGGSFFIQDGSTYNGTAGAGKVATWINNLCVFSSENGTIEVTQAAMDRALQDVAGMESYYANGNFHFTIDNAGHVILATGSAMGSGTSNGKIAADKTLTATNTISLRADGSAQLASKNGSTTRYLWWIISSKKFSYYSATSAGTTYYPVYLYKLVTDEGGEGDVVVAPEAPTASVQSGDYSEPFDLTLACATEGATIKYTLNGGEEQTYSAPINIAATTTLVAWAEKDALKSEEVTFTYTLPELPAEVANIAAFIADESGKNVRIASTMTVILRSGKNVWVKDESGYMLVSGQVASKNPSYNPGDQFTGLVGKATTANGVKQLTPANFPATTATGVVVEPEVVAAADVTLAIPHKYVKIEGAKLVSKNMLELTASVGEITFRITDIATKYMNDKTIVAGDYINLAAIVSADAKGLMLNLVSMEEVEAPEVPEVPEAPAPAAVQYGGGYFTSETLQVELTTTETRPNYILVTIDGSEPSFEGVAAGTTSYCPSGQKLPLTESTIVKVRTILFTAEGQPYQTAEGAYLYSDVVSAKFTKLEVPAAPVFTPAPGDYYDSVLVSIACATENVLVKYEFGGIEPTGRSATYTEPFKLTSATTVSAIAYLVDLEGNPYMTVEELPVASVATFATYNVTPYVAPEAPATPTIQYGGGYFTSDMLSVALTTTETRPNYILVTIDGSEPSFEGVMTGATIPVPSGQPIQLTGSKIVKVRGMLLTAEGAPYQTPAGAYIYSDVVSAKFTKLEAPAAPVFTPAPGDYYDSVLVSIACATENVLVKYEFGGTEPTGRSATYTEPFKLTSATTVSAIAYLTDLEGNPYMTVEELPVASAATFATYNVTPYVAPEAPAVPTIQYGGGYFTSDMLQVVVNTTETRPSYILVTIDGSEPSFEGVQAGTTLPAAPGQPIQLTATTTVKVRGLLVDTSTGLPYQTPAGAYIYSEVASAIFTKVEAPAAPEFTPAAGEYADSVIVSIACATENVMIKYEFGGTEPTGRSATYTEPFKLTATTVVSAVAYLVDAEGAPIMDVEEMPIASAATFAEYKVKETIVVAAPVFTPAPGEYLDKEALNVSLSCATADAKIYWTYGTDASVNQYSFEYEREIPVDAKNNTISAIAVLFDDNAKVVAKSEVVYATYTLKEKEVKPIEINFTPAPGEYEGSVNVTIEYLNVPDGGMCMYSIDGTDPMREYKSTTTITLTETTTVKARVLISMSPSFQFSETVEAVYTIKPAAPEYVAPAAPVFTPEAGEYNDSVAVSMTCETENALILYDVLGLTPNFTSPRFEGEPIIIKETTTIAAIAVLVDAEGEVILDAEEMPYMSEVVTATYVVKPNEDVAVDNVELVAVVYAKGGMVYVDTELGNTIEVFTVQGQCIFAAEATSELTTIDAFNADVLLVRVNGQTIKVAIK